MAQRKIHITQDDATKLRELLKSGLRYNNPDQENLRALQRELDRAKIVAPDALTPDVVTMNSTVRVKDTRDSEPMEFTLVFPEHADPVNGQISVVAPLGAAVLGYKAGDRVRFKTPGGERTVEIEQVLYQPEAAGHTGG